MLITKRISNAICWSFQLTRNRLLDIGIFGKKFLFDFDSFPWPELKFIVLCFVAIFLLLLVIQCYTYILSIEMNHSQYSFTFLSMTMPHTKPVILQSATKGKIFLTNYFWEKKLKGKNQIATARRTRASITETMFEQ